MSNTKINSLIHYVRMHAFESCYLIALPEDHIHEIEFTDGFSGEKLQKKLTKQEHIEMYDANFKSFLSLLVQVMHEEIQSGSMTLDEVWKAIENAEDEWLKEPRSADYMRRKSHKIAAFFPTDTSPSK